MACAFRRVYHQVSAIFGPGYGHVKGPAGLVGPVRGFWLAGLIAAILPGPLARILACVMARILTVLLLPVMAAILAIAVIETGALFVLLLAAGFLLGGLFALRLRQHPRVMLCMLLKVFSRHAIVA